MTRHVLSLASGGAADVPGATGTREVSPTIISRGIFDARALRMAYAQGCAGMRTCEGAWGCARRGNAAHARRAHGRTRRGQQTRTRTCFRRDGFCSHPSESPRRSSWTAAIARHARKRCALLNLPSGRSCFPKLPAGACVCSCTGALLPVGTSSAALEPRSAVRTKETLLKQKVQVGTHRLSP